MIKYNICYYLYSLDSDSLLLALLLHNCALSVCNPLKYIIHRVLQCMCISLNIIFTIIE